jgi:hypothetical protein
MLNFLLIAFIVTGALIIAQGLLIRRKYRGLFDDENLFSELPRMLASRKAAALDLAGTPTAGSDDSRAGITSGGLVFAYTAEDTGTGVLNHISLSYRGERLTLAFGARCAFHLLTFLGIDPAEAEVAHSRRGVLHIGFLLDSDEVEDFLDRPLHVPSASEIPAQKTSAENWVHELRTSGRLLGDELEILPALMQGTAERVD